MVDGEAAIRSALLDNLFTRVRFVFKTEFRTIRKYVQLLGEQTMSDERFYVSLSMVIISILDRFVKQLYTNTISEHDHPSIVYRSL